MIREIIIQFIGAVGYSLVTLSYFKKTKEKILLVQIIAYIMFTLHFYLLNAVTGAICNFVGMLAMISIYLLEKYKLKFKSVVGIGFAIVLVVINISTFQNIFSVFPMIASVISILSFLTNNENDIRVVGIISALCWLVYAVMYKSYISIIFEIVTLIGVIIAFFRNKKRDSIKKTNYSV